MEQWSDLKGVVQALPSQVGIELSNWNWKAVRRFVADRFGFVLSRSSCLNYLHRLGFVLKRPRKRMLNADLARREVFVGGYAALTVAAARTGTKIFFADEAHFQADADLRGKWVLKGEPALVNSTSPRRGEKVSYYSAVCLEIVVGRSAAGLLLPDPGGVASLANIRTAALLPWQVGHPAPGLLILPRHSGSAC